MKRQPNLVSAAARWHGLEPGPYPALRRFLLEHWDEMVPTIKRRRTQTNEAGRCAQLVPLLASLPQPQPLALVEVGASAGLTLVRDRYFYSYRCDEGDAVSLDPTTGRARWCSTASCTASARRRRCQRWCGGPGSTSNRSTRLPQARLWSCSIPLSSAISTTVTDSGSVTW
ncbi:MAG: DUF2332 family protein [Terracoccus sp.]